MLQLKMLISRIIKATNTHNKQTKTLQNNKKKTITKKQQQKHQKTRTKKKRIKDRF